MRILAGTSGFAFKEWKGPFYPEDLKDKDFLAYYASKFPTVEINNTFYQLPKTPILESWAAQVPADFSFTIKASRRITHFARLKPESAETVQYMLTTLSVLGERLGPILFQLPPNLKREMDRLAEFLRVLPSGKRYAMEFRHESWFGDDLFALLREHNVALVTIEQEDFASPLASTAEWGYVRLHRMDYKPDDIAAWAKKITSQGWNEAYVFFKHDHTPEAGSGPLAVDGFLKACSAPA